MKPSCFTSQKTSSSFVAFRKSGEWVKGANAKPNIHPSDVSDVIDEYGQADVADVNCAVSAARAAFPGWSLTMPRISSAIFKQAG